jgi:hypothetical protein
MKAMIPARKHRIQEAQTLATVAATLAEGTRAVATREEVAATPEAATQVVATREEVTPVEEDPVGDKMMAGGTP